MDGITKNLWRLVCPLSTRWVRYNTGYGSFVTRKKYYVFGIKVADMQTTDPSPS